MVGDLADPAEETESDLLVGATLVGGDLVGVIDVPRVFAALEGRRHDRRERAHWAHRAHVGPLAKRSPVVTDAAHRDWRTRLRDRWVDLR